MGSLMDEKKLAWEAYREAWNTRGSRSDMTDLEERTARRKFDEWWEKKQG